MADADEQTREAMIRDKRTLACPLCDYTIDVAPVPVLPALAEALGTSGHALAMVHGARKTQDAANAMYEHLQLHDVLEWLAVTA